MLEMPQMKSGQRLEFAPSVGAICTNDFERHNKIHRGLGGTGRSIYNQEEGRVSTGEFKLMDEEISEAESKGIVVGCRFECG